MKLLGKVKKIMVDTTGLESCVQIDFSGDVGELTCYMLLSESYNPDSEFNEVMVYVEDKEPKKLKKSDEVIFKLKIINANKYEKKKVFSDSPITQSINKSPHSQFCGVIKNKLNDCTVVCFVNEVFKKIEVLFEENIECLNIGEIIKFNGEIQAELLD